MIKKCLQIALGVAIIATATGCKSKQKIALEELNSSLNGEWLVKSVGNTTYNDNTTYPTLFLKSDANTYSAFDGCNRQQGSYSFDKKTGNILFAAGLSTMMMCPNPLNTGISYDIPTVVETKNIDGEDYLYLTNSQTKQKTVLHKLTPNVLSGKWLISEINGEKFDNPELTMTFDIPAMRVNGTTDCNSFSGQLITDADQPLSLKFLNVAVSMRMCPNMTAERKILDALSKVTEFDFKKSTLVYLKGSNNTSICLTKAK